MTNRTKVARILCFLLWLTPFWPASCLWAERDLETGTFLTRDPAGMVDGPNLYSYVRQNPWTHFDPEGLATDLSGGGKYMNGRVMDGGTAFNDGEQALFNITGGHGNATDHAVIDRLNSGLWGQVALPLARLGLEHSEEAEKIGMAMGAGIVASSNEPGAAPMRVQPRTTGNSVGLAEAELPVNKFTTANGNPGGKSAKTTIEESRITIATVADSATNPEQGGRYSGRYADGEKAYRTNVPRDSNQNPIPDPAAVGAHSRLQVDARNSGRVYSATEFDETGKAVKRIDFAGRKGDTLPHQHSYDPSTKGFGPKEPLDKQ